ncbi:cilia- and flagella-associated protein 206-like [Anthonomus grandis grandis]|uniref:cilia- and flagella-associated protein 206-like n=1 Tax=Anthonomus grandis grandis TaxID=2921223 RepID=UPI0021664916|nr:cilia- and flagella-associated protein 206-like [Anthonomus grandis grandis]
MKTNTATENLIRNIVTEVLRECKTKKIRASSQFILYYIGLLQLDPNRELNEEILRDRAKVQSFVKYVISSLEKDDDPKVITLRLQQEFRHSIQNLDEAVKRFRFRLKSKLYPLMIEIIEQDKKNTGDQLFKKICYYVILASGLGNPSKRPVLKEAFQVLKSILEPEEIRIFPSIQNYIKQELLESLINIVMGIRLYNRYCKRGGEGIEDLPELLEKAIQAVGRELNKCIEQSMERVKLLTLSVEKNIIITKKGADWVVFLNFQSDEEKQQWNYRRDLAIAHRQLVKTSRVLLESTVALGHHAQDIISQINEVYRELEKVIISNLYQAVTDVFPHFTLLAHMWKELQNDAVRLKQILSIFRVQSRQIMKIKYETPEREYSRIDAWMITEDEALITNVKNPDVIIHAKSKVFTKKDLQFNGYCCWILINTDGALVPAKIDLGVVEYKRKFYGFSTRMAANSFARRPWWYIANTLILARNKVYLIKFLNLERTLMKFAHLKTLIMQKQESTKLLKSKECQTDTHFQLPHIDYSYQWNLWEYKRAALEMFDIKTKKTVSTATDKTHQKEAAFSQTYENTDSQTQTRVDNCINTKRSKQFIHGLRGLKNNYPFVMDLTEPLNYNQVPKDYLSKESL